MSDEIGEAMQELRKFMFENVYLNPVAKREEGKAEQLVERLYSYYMENAEQMPQEFLQMIQNGEKKEQVICDYIAGMTDNYAINTFQEIFIPESWKI